MGFIPSKADLDRYGLVEGDELFIVHGPEGLSLVPYNSEYVEQVKHAREFMDTYKDTFKELAK